MEKWVIIAVVIVMLGGFVGMGFEQYHHSQCVTSYSHSNRSAEDIAKICKK